ncbi:hypothetical protein BLA60_19590 [Actinophytocola xinjiangensis]|uniref:DUF445 domain-containing protein n=1 Tax=Actinophytocola xinjiangensis TaxID=485602 RepID=A0A7Z0WKX0_9PSEU|nr:hypothetical protein [Actinophytocola xinjiangensis]OLF09378.1 hypothetical protein BLA60_19590 [Actinophytocola xinjiangensis]
MLDDPRLLSHLISIPLFTGVIGYITNWTGVLMMFAPMRFHGVRLPGLRLLYPYLPRRVQVIPAITPEGRFGWQGIIPSRVAKMASISVDKALLKVGSIGDFYREFEPDRIAEHLATTARGEIREVIERVMEREHPRLWQDLPPVVRAAVFARIEQRLPVIIRGLTDELGEYIEQLIDAKLLVIRYFEAHPELLNDMLREVGRKELRFMQNFGFYFGFPMGIGLVFLVEAFPHWWVLPLGGAVIGWVVNWIGLKLIFEPVFPRKVGPFTLHGLFLRRQPEVSDVLAEIIANDVITMENVGDELLHGPRSDRTRQLLETSLRPAIDSAVGFARSAVRVGLGSRRYDRIRDAVAAEAVTFASALGDKEFGRQQSRRIRSFVAGQMRQLPYDEFNELLRSAIKQDEWLLFVHGGVLGIGAGLVHLAIFGV